MFGLKVYMLILLEFDVKVWWGVHTYELGSTGF